MTDQSTPTPKRGRGRPKSPNPRPRVKDTVGPPKKPEAEKLVAARITIKKGELERNFEGKIEQFQEWLYAQYLQFGNQQNPENEQQNEQP